MFLGFHFHNQRPTTFGFSLDYPKVNFNISLKNIDLKKQTQVSFFALKFCLHCMLPISRSVQRFLTLK